MKRHSLSTPSASVSKAASPPDHPQVVHTAPKESRGPRAVEFREVGSIDAIVDNGGDDATSVGKDTSKKKNGEET